MLKKRFLRQLSPCDWALCLVCKAVKHNTLIVIIIQFNKLTVNPKSVKSSN